MIEELITRSYVSYSSKLCAHAHIHTYTERERIRSGGDTYIHTYIQTAHVFVDESIRLALLQRFEHSPTRSTITRIAQANPCLRNQWSFVHTSIAVIIQADRKVFETSTIE